ncbi:hypothetical protein RJT34_05773 [Clitoria ternatea]|uniref:Encoded peptide n=1 Tax=Clitoria ternatea TaxID=43366 RepID=A0AAN9K3D3_CLITE
MVEFQAMHKYFAILLALMACHGSVFSHGRQIKVPLKQNSSLNTNTPKVASPIMPKLEGGSGDSGANYANGFRPTTPGNSPGIGHRKFGEDKDMKVVGALVQSPDVKVSVTKGNDFRPTGHSPGVGHSGENKNEHLN